MMGSGRGSLFQRNAITGRQSPHLPASDSPPNSTIVPRTRTLDDSGQPKCAQIIAMVERGIAAGTYPAGAWLPSESQLGREFSVSRPTVVRALDILRARGVIASRKGRGSYVSS